MLSSIILVAALAIITVAENPKCFSGKNKKVDSCCDGYNQFVIKNAMKQCGLTKVSEIYEDQPCSVYTCLLKNAKILDSNNKVNKTLAADCTAFPKEWQEAHRSSSGKCIPELNKKGIECEPKIYSLCYYRHMFTNCPTKLWTKGPICNEMKEQMQKCK